MWELRDWLSERGVNEKVVRWRKFKVLDLMNR